MFPYENSRYNDTVSADPKSKAEKGKRCKIEKKRKKKKKKKGD